MAIRLKERLLLAAELAGTGNTVMDVGCDHAHLDIYLLQTGRFARAVAMDIGEGPLESARENIELTELTDRCELRRSDGLEKAEEGEADVLVICGMGGSLMQEILSAFPEKTASFAKLVLSPQSEPFLVRDYLLENGFGITDECLVKEDGKLYTLIAAKSGVQTLRPDWEELLARCRQGGDPVSASLTAVLTEKSFRRELERKYGPGILAKTLSGTDPDETPSLFLDFVRRSLREKLVILDGLSGASEDERTAGRRRVRMEQLSEEAACLQALLGLRQIITGDQ